MPKAFKPSATTYDPDAWTPERIRALRERLGYTQTQLGSACGVKLRAVQYWEEGKSPSGSAAKMLSMLETSAGRK